MADQTQRRTQPNGERPSPPANRTPGWRVTPAPNGRGRVGKEGQPPTPSRSRWWIALAVVALLGLNLWISSQALKPNAPVRIPYSPTFLSQVKGGNVEQISSTGDSIQGTFKKAIRYPSNDANVQATTNFSTQVPSFANNQQLSGLLQDEGVTIDAQAPEQRAVGDREPDLRLRPDAAADRAVRVDHPPRQRRRRGRRPDVVRPLARAARRGLRPGDHVRGRRRDRRGQGRADRDRRFPQGARQVPQAWRAGSRAACCSAASPEPARRCSRARSPARRESRSSRCRRRSSSR